MVTELLLAGLLLASSAGPWPIGAAQPAPVGLHSDARPDGQACGSDPRSALLEAHAAYAALPPFSLVRIPATVAPKDAPAVKGIPGCKS